MASRIGTEVHRRLAAGEPPEVIARAVGRSMSAVYDHRANKCKCLGRAESLPSIDTLLDIGAATEELNALFAMEPEPEPLHSQGVPPLPTLEDCRAVGMSKSEAEAALAALEKFPDWWLRLISEARAETAAG